MIRKIKETRWQNKNESILRKVTSIHVLLIIIERCADRLKIFQIRFSFFFHSFTSTTNLFSTSISLRNWITPKESSNLNSNVSFSLVSSSHQQKVTTNPLVSLGKRTNEAAHPPWQSSTELLFRGNSLARHTRGSKYVRPSLMVFRAKGKGSWQRGERGQPWVFSSFGPNRGRKAVDKEVSPAAGRKADLLSRIAEAGRVQLVSGV